MVFDEEWMKTNPIPPRPQEDDDEKDDKDESTCIPDPTPNHVQGATDSDVASVAPTRHEHLELKRFVRIAEAHHTRNERAHASHATSLHNGLPSGEEVVLIVASDPALYFRAIRSDEKTMWEVTIKAEYLFLNSNSKVIGYIWKF